jgi:hypothetical protein
MTERNLAKELEEISREVSEILWNEQIEAREIQRRFSEDEAAIRRLFQAVGDAKANAKWRDAHFNLFEILGRPRLEQAHSHLLAWLFDPTQAHGLGDAFLQDFMRKAIGFKPPCTAEVRVSCEMRCGSSIFDIVVEGSDWSLVVENKIDAPASEGQRCDYEGYCKLLRNRRKKAWLVYVQRSKSGKRSITYRDIREILQVLNPSPEAAIVIEHFNEHVLLELEQ